jgi:hypothetical protein
VEKLASSEVVSLLEPSENRHILFAALADIVQRPRLETLLKLHLQKNPKWFFVSFRLTGSIIYILSLLKLH